MRIGKVQPATDLTLETDNLTGWPNSSCDLNRGRIAQLTVVDCLFVTLAQQDLPGTRVALERTFAAAQAKRVRRTRRQQPGDG